MSSPGKRKAAECNESIRQHNLGTCHTSTYGPCQTAVQLGTSGTPHKAKSCGGVLGACGTAHHDKSKCFLASPVGGSNAEERERWHVVLPTQLNGKSFPYTKPGRDKNLHVLLINPKNAKMVVCSQEGRGPQATSTGNPAMPEASVVQNEFMTKGRLAGLSYEASWKLELPKTGGDPVVLLAFVPNTTPLGPVPDGTKIRLKDKATIVEILGAYAAS